jgi:nucleoside-diphosphate-sugar epimerase
LKETILVAGGTGFLGYHFIKKALKIGFKVISISKNDPPQKRFFKKIKYIKSDICNLKILNKKLNIKFNYVVNFSGYVDHGNKKKTYQSHYIGCKNLVKICLNRKIKRFIQIGSSMEYGRNLSPQNENFRCRPLSVYAKAKFFASKYLLGLYKKKKFPVTILRLYQVYGPNQDLNRFIPVVINSCRKDLKFPCSNGEQYRDFLYVDDFVRAVFFSISNKKSIGKIINLGSGKPLKIKKIIQKIVKIYKKGKPMFGKIKLRKEEMRITYPDISNAKSILKWKPTISFKKGILKTVRYYNESSR